MIYILDDVDVHIVKYVLDDVYVKNIFDDVDVYTAKDMLDDVYY